MLAGMLYPVTPAWLLLMLKQDVARMPVNDW